MSLAFLHVPTTLWNLSLLCVVLTFFLMLLSKSDSVCEQPRIFIGRLRNLRQHHLPAALTTVHSQFLREIDPERSKRISTY